MLFRVDIKYVFLGLAGISLITSSLCVQGEVTEAPKIHAELNRYVGEWRFGDINLLGGSLVLGHENDFQPGEDIRCQRGLLGITDGFCALYRHYRGFSQQKFDIGKVPLWPLSWVLIPLAVPFKIDYFEQAPSTIVFPIIVKNAFDRPGFEAAVVEARVAGDLEKTLPEIERSLASLKQLSAVSYDFPDSNAGELKTELSLRQKEVHSQVVDAFKQKLVIQLKDATGLADKAVITSLIKKALVVEPAFALHPPAFSEVPGSDAVPYKFVKSDFRAVEWPEFMALVDGTLARETEIHHLILQKLELAKSNVSAINHANQLAFDNYSAGLAASVSSYKVSWPAVIGGINATYEYRIEPGNITKITEYRAGQRPVLLVEITDKLI